VPRIFPAFVLLAACSGDATPPPDAPAPRPNNRCYDDGTPGATAPCLSPTRDEAFYIDQALRYFDTLDVDADRSRVPTYDPQVARWEWPPWLLLTAYGRDDMIEVSDSLRELDPSTVPSRDCRFFPTQPFARCYVVFEYEQGSCPIYEEFTFDDDGEMTFIEAWSDLPGRTPTTPDDRWGEADDFPRLANRIPGLGTPDGSYDLAGPFMQAAAARDPEVADFAERATDWWAFWFEALGEAERDFFAKGCGWPNE